jgi:Ca2+-binding EF-hand superfamily protein
VNGDGIITEQELANARISQLAVGIGNTLKPMFDGIDLDLDGVIDYEEFGKQFAGMASDAELKRIFHQLDVNGDGTISAIEAGKASTDEVSSNTKPIEGSARDQLAKLNGLIDEMSRSTDQFAGLNTTTISLLASINALRAAQDEIRDVIADGLSDLTDGIATTIAGSFNAIDFNRDDVIDWSEFRSQFEGLVDNDTLRSIFGALDNNGNGVIDQLESNTRAIESWSSQQPDSAQGAIQQMLDMYEEILGRQADLPGIDYYLDQYFDGMSLEEIRARISDSDEARGGGSGSSSGGYTSGGTDAEGDPLLSDVTGDLADVYRDTLGRAPDDSGYAYYQDQLSSGSMTLDEIRDRLANSPEAKGYALGGVFSGGVQAFAKGGMFANSIVDDPTYFNMGLMGEAGPEAIMPLQRGANGVLGVRAELPPVSLPPLLGKDDAIEVLRDMQREMALLRRENKELLGRIEQHGGAAVAVQQAGFQRQISEQQRGNRSLDEMRSSARLAASR